MSDIEKQGFYSDIMISDKLSTVLNIHKGIKTNRIDITKKVLEYVKNNKLQLDDDKRLFRLDNNLKIAFNTTDEIISYGNLQQFLKNCIIKI